MNSHKHPSMDGSHPSRLSPKFASDRPTYTFPTLSSPSEPTLEACKTRRHSTKQNGKTEPPRWRLGKPEGLLLLHLSSPNPASKPGK